VVSFFGGFFLFRRFMRLGQACIFPFSCLSYFGRVRRMSAYGVSSSLLNSNALSLSSDMPFSPPAVGEFQLIGEFPGL